MKEIKITKTEVEWLRRALEYTRNQMEESNGDIDQLEVMQNAPDDEWPEYLQDILEDVDTLVDTLMYLYDSMTSSSRLELTVK